MNEQRVKMYRGGSVERTRIRKRRIAVGIMSVSAIGVCAAQAIPTTNELTARQLPQIQRNVNRLMPLADIEVAKPKMIKFSKEDHDGKSFRSLNSYYVGKARVEIDWQNVDLAQNLTYMWARKMKTYDVTPAVRKSVDNILLTYRNSPHETTTLQHFVKQADEVVRTSRASIDFAGLCGKYGLDDARCTVFKRLIGQINGRVLVAYGMTELFPSRDGATNRDLLDVMLRRAGTDYLDTIPALGDKYLSMGFYQFTSFAVRHDADGREGANRVVEFSSERLPGSVMNLKGRDQHRAAFYFATFNVLLALRKDSLNSRQFSNIQHMKRVKESDLATFMATAHHLPVGARRAMAAWAQEGGTLPLTAYQRGNLRIYGSKSASNLKALT